MLNHGINNDINMRVFEAMASGSMLLTNEVDGQNLLLKNERHIVTYEDTEDAILKIRYYLKHSDERERIAKAGAIEARNHTYTKRAEKILAQVEALV